MGDADEEYNSDFEPQHESESEGEVTSDNPEDAKCRLEELLKGETVELAQIHKITKPLRTLDFPLPESGNSPLELTILNKHYHATSFLLSELKCDADLVCGFISTCLAWCVDENNNELVDVCAALLQHGASPNARMDKNDSNSMSCIHSAIGNNNERLVRLLLEYNADLNVLWNDMSPGGLAKELGNGEIVAMFQDQSDVRKDQVVQDHFHDYTVAWEDISIDKPLGSGGFGSVFRAKIKKSGDQVAVKKMAVQDDGVLQTFKKEVQMLSSFRHENIVLFRGACLELPHLCIITELMSTGNLFALLQSQQEIHWQLRLRWIRDIARGMNYLHNLCPPVVHRDLKSPNVLVNDYYQVKLCDFGMSRSKQHTMINTKDRGGSPLWMAPECLRGESFTEKSDVYSFGVVMWEVLTRQVPWVDKEPVQLVGLVGFRGQTLSVPATYDAPPQYIEIMKNCWHGIPEQRPSFQHIVSVFEELTNV